MKEFLLYAAIIVFLIGCKNEQNLYDAGKSININIIKADFERETGYKQKDSTFINPNFKSNVDWKTFYEIGQDTLYVKVEVTDRLEMLVSDSTRILLNDNVWIRGTRKSDKWQYSALTFIPSSNKAGYNGIIISKSLQSGAQNISFYEANTKVPAQLIKRAGKAPAMPTDCIYGYVNGILNEISCPAGSGNDDERDDPPYSGDPRDYQNIPPLGDGGSGESGDGTVPTYTSKEDKEIIDSLQGYPCAQAVLTKLPNLENRISEWLKKTFVNNTDFTLIFRTSKTLSDSVDAEHYSGNQSGSDQYITLNGNMLKTASQEYIAATIFHEALHGFLHMEKFRLEERGTPEQFGILYPGIVPTMVGGEYKFVLDHNEYGTLLEDLKKAIQSFSPSTSDFDAMALAKGGVIQNLSTVEKSVNYANKKGNAGTTCN